MKKNIKYVIYILCFAGLAFLDWLSGSQRGDFFVEIIMISHFSWKNQPKGRYFIWTLLWLTGSVAGYFICCGDGGMIFPTQYWAAAISAWLLGTVALRMWGEREQIQKQSGRVPFLWIVWLVMSVLMCVSRMGETWSGWYVVIFGLFYLMPYSEEERRALWSSLADAMILFFFCMQIWAYGFRPYDEVRYSGAYGDCINAALFYMVTYIALLYRSHSLRWQERVEGVAVSPIRKTVKAVLWFLTVGMWGFVLLTMTRTALLVMIGVTLAYGIIEFMVTFPERWHRLLLRMVAFVVGIIVLFPVVYGTARYLPTILHHPVWFAGEYSVDKVHSYDPADSEKYVSMEEVLENLLGRLGVKLSGWFQGSVAGEESQLLLVQGAADPHSTPEKEQGILVASIDAGISMPDNSEREQGKETFADEGEYELLTGDDTLNSGKIRLRIWELYLKHLNWRGHELEEGYFSITADYHSWHAQNVFLQIAFYHGIIPGILLVVLLVGLGVRALLLAIRHRRCEDILPLLVGILFVGFGMLEIVWYPGQTVLYLMYLLPKILIDARRDM